MNTKLIFLFLVIPLAINSQGLVSEKEAVTLSESILNLFIEGSVEKAFEKAGEHSIINKNQMDTMTATTREQIDTIYSNYGKMKGFELLKKKKINNSLLHLQYMVLCENYPLQFQFVYYKSDDKWILIDIKWNDKLYQLLNSSEN